MTIAITGSTGHLGRLVLRRLGNRLQGRDLVALARNLEKAAGLGVTAREADYDRPETLLPALAGVDTLLLISANEVGKRTAQHHNVIDAAARAGVQRIIYTSILHADTSPIGLASEHLATETEVRASGMAFTFLRNGWYTENYTAAIPEALARGEFTGCAGDARIASATRADYADAAVSVLTSTGHDGIVYELAGDDSWTLKDLAAEVSRQTGGSVSYRDLPPEEYVAALQDSGYSEGMARLVAGWDVAAAEGALFDDSHQLSRLIGHLTTPLPVAVTAALEAAQRRAA